jgi:hypothetical protein
MGEPKISQQIFHVQVITLLADHDQKRSNHHAPTVELETPSGIVRS